MSVRRWWASVALASLLGATGCSSGDDGTPIASIYDVPDSLDALSGEAFLDHPFPSDFRVEDGAPVYRGFYNPRAVKLLDEYVEVTEGLLDGFSPSGTGYLRFTGPLDPATLPADPLAATDPAASVQLIDIDPASPEQGERKLVSLQYRRDAGVYTLDSTLAFMPTVGFPLRHGTRYALVVTQAISGEDGGAVRPSAHLSQALGIESASGAREVWRGELSDAVDAIETAGVPRGQIAHLAVFTTSNPTTELEAVRDHMRAEVDPPAFDSDPNTWSVSEGSGRVEYRGRYGPTPDYQVGTHPFAKYGDGGNFNFVGGVPEVVELYDQRFSLTVPDSPACPMPADGYPIVLYAHGTGGSYRTYATGVWARELAERCIASMGTDQILHGERKGAPDNPLDVQLLFFNFQNIVAARTNGRQQAIDDMTRARLFTESAATIPADISHTGAAIRFDPAKVLFFGHSQGGIDGPLFLAVDDAARGGILSGAGGQLAIALLEKTEPAPAVATLVSTLILGLKGEELEEFNLFHPVLMVAQSLLDVLDPLNYAHMMTRDPRAGFAPKSIYISEGIGPDGVGDNYTPPHSTEALAIAAGMPLQLPGQYPVLELAYGGPTPVTVPAEGLSGNVGGGQASGIHAQWPPTKGDGHFVMHDDPVAIRQGAEFLKALADDPVGRVPAP